MNERDDKAYLDWFATTEGLHVHDTEIAWQAALSYARTVMGDASTRKDEGNNGTTATPTAAIVMTTSPTNLMEAMNERELVMEMCKAYNSVLLNQPQNERNQYLAMQAALAYALTVMGKSGDSDDGHKVQFESALPTNINVILKETYDDRLIYGGKTFYYGDTKKLSREAIDKLFSDYVDSTRKDAKPVASASDDTRLAFEARHPKLDLRFDEHTGYLADFTAEAYAIWYCAWQACEAQHKQKVRECIAEIAIKNTFPDEDSSNYDHDFGINSGLRIAISLINKHFGE